jgi:hypothetical protein
MPSKMVFICDKIISDLEWKDGKQIRGYNNGKFYKQIGGENSSDI